MLTKNKVPNRECITYDIGILELDFRTNHDQLHDCHCERRKRRGEPARNTENTTHTIDINIGFDYRRIKPAIGAILKDA